MRPKLHGGVLLGIVVLVAACDSKRDLTTPSPDVPFEASQLCHGRYSPDQLASWFESAAPTVMAVEGAVFFDDDEAVQCLRIGVLDRPAGEAVERALAASSVPRDAAIIEFSEPVRFAGH